MSFLSKLSFYLFALIIFSANFELGFSQTVKTESISDLNEKLELATGFERIVILQSLAMKERFYDPDKALVNAQESLTLSKLQQNDSLIAESYFRIGLIKQLKGENIEALDVFLNAHVLFKEKNIVSREMVVLNSLGAIYTDIGQFEKAIEFFFRTLEYSKATNNFDDEIFSLTYIGRNYSNSGDYLSSKRYFNEAVQIAINYDSWINGVIALTELGTIESQMGYPDSAAIYFQKAIDWLEAKGSYHSVPSIKLSMALAYRDKNRLGESLSLIKESIALSDSLGMELFVVNAVRDLALVYQLMGEYEKSILSINEVLNTEDDTKILQSTRFDILAILAGSYLQINQLEKAIEISKRAVFLSIENKSWVRADSSLSILIESETKSGKFEDAISSMKLKMRVKDSTYVQEREWASQEYDALHQLTKKEQEIALLEIENKQKAIIQIGMIIVVLLILIIAFLILRSQFIKVQKSNIRLENEELKRRQLEQDLEFKNKQIVTQSLNILQKKELILDMKDKVEKFKEEGSVRELSKLSNQIDYSFTLDKDWDDFKLYFEEVHVDFYNALKSTYGELTPNEMKLSALVKLNLSIKETASILGISPDSVKKARYRLRKKLGLSTEENLVEFMIAIEREILMEL